MTFNQIKLLIGEMSSFFLKALLRFISYPSILQTYSYNYKIDQKGAIRLTKHTLINYLIVATVLFGTGIVYLFNPFWEPKEAEAAWFNDNWFYRVAYTLPNHSALETNVYYPLTIDTATLTTEKLQADCDDIRFTDQSGNLLDYYIVSGCDSASTVINVNFKSYASGVATIYFYYGNPSAPRGGSTTNFSTAASNTSATLNLQVSQSTDDAVEEGVVSGGGVTDTRTWTGTGTAVTNNNGTGGFYNSPGRHATANGDTTSMGARFQSVTIPQGSTISSASFILNPQATYNASPNTVTFHVSAEDADNSATFSTTGGMLNATNRPRTTAECGIWTQTSITGGAEESRDVTSCVQEVIDRAGWASGNALSIIIDTYTTTSNSEWQDYESYDSTAAEAPKLNITYGSGSVSAGSEEKGPSPTLYWEFDQAQGTTAEDATSNGLDGTLNNTPTWQTENMCIANFCLYFSATNQNVSLADNDKIDFIAADNFTLGAWIKRVGASSGNTVIMQKTGANIGSTYTGYKLYMDASGDLCFDIQDGTNAVDSACTSAIDFDDDSWHFVQGVKAGTSSVTLYVDGKQRAQDASIASTGTLANSSTYRVGIDSDGTSNDWLGFIDEVKVTRDQTARTVAQVQADYNTRGDREGTSQQQGNNIQNMPAVLSNGLIGYWKLDESSGNATDSSGNSLTLTNNNTVAYSSGRFANAGSFTAASSRYLSTATTISGVKTIAFWTKNSSTTDEYINLTASAYITSSSGTLSATGLTSPKIYVNGVLNGTLTSSVWNHVAISTDTAVNANQFEIGRGNSAYNNGQIDDTRVYNRALSQNDISQLYNWGPGPLAYWKMDEGSWTNNCSTDTVFDSSGNGFNGDACPSSTGPTGGAIGKYGKAGNFDGSNDYLAMGTGMNLTGAMSVSAWIKIDTLNSNFRDIVTKMDSSGCASPYEFGIGNDNIFYLGWTNNVCQYEAWQATGFTPVINTWYYVTATRDSSLSTMYIYVNGVKYSTSLSPGTSVVSIETGGTSPVSIGRAGDFNGQYFDGIIDDVRLYNYEQTPAQVVADMNAGHPAPGSPVGTPVGFWKFNEGVDNTCSGGTNDVCNSGSGSTTLDGTSTATRTNSGKLSRALDFDGTDDVVTVTNTTSIDFDTGLTNFTFSSWVYADSDGEADTGQILNKGTSTYFRVDSQDGSNNLDLECNLDRATTDTNVNVTDALTTASWNYVACSWDGTTLSVYVNGRLAGSSSSGSGAISTDTNNLLIGGGTSNNFDGKIDDFKVYNSALTASQIALDANAASTQVLGAMGNNSTAGALNAASQEYCIPGDSTTCTTPVGRWDFEQGSSTTAYDTSGNGNNCTVGASAWRSGKVGKALEYLDGSYGSSTCGTGSTLNNLQNSGMTVEGWIRPDSMGENNYGQIAFKGWEFGFNGAGTNGLYFKVNYSGTSLERPTADSVVTLNAWNHVAVTWTGSQTATNAKIYVNGREVSYGSPTNGSGTRDDSAEDLRIGDNSGQTLNFDGLIDQVRVFNYVRTAAQINYDMSRGAPVGYWKLDDCQGTTVNDSSGFGNTGTWSGSGGGNTSAGTCNTAGTAWGDGATGKRNSSLEFDGTDDVVNAGSGTMLDNLPANGMGFSVWMKPNGLGENSTAFVIDKNTGSTQNAGWLFHVLGTNSLLFAVDGSTDLVVQTSNNVWTTGGWNHIALTWAGDITSASSVHIYVNGKEVTYSTQTNGASRVDDASSSFYIGNDSTGARTFDGQIDDVKVFNYSPTATQIQNLYNDGAVRYGPVTGSP